MRAEMLADKISIGCRWELIQSFCFNENIFLCLIRGCGGKYFLFVSEETKVNNIYEFEELRTAQEHFSILFNDLSKNKHVERIIFSE
ncbi:MAG: hypothetical protein ACFFCD_12290 [Promethearchaeota archaeon]